MDKRTIWIVLGTAVATLVLAGKLRQLPGVNKLPTV